jgi:hypothetical protein
LLILLKFRALSLCLSWPHEWSTRISMSDTFPYRLFKIYAQSSTWFTKCS